MTRRSAIPLDESESERLEFKSARALGDPRALAREVVAFLNARGGHLWIGLAEKEGVAVQEEPIDHLRVRAMSLQDALTDRIEPAPSIGHEVKIVCVPGDAPDRGLLRIEVSRGSRGPYAFLDRTLRGYAIRTGSRIRDMSREELREAFAQAPRKDEREQLSAALQKKMADTAASGFQGIQVLIEPIRRGLWAWRRDELEPLLRDASATGNRPLGWVFTDPRGALKFTPRGFTFGRAAEHRIVVTRTGALQYREALERLLWKGLPREIWPYALIELPTSVVRLARALYASHAAALAPNDTIGAAIGLFGVKGWIVRPGSPRSLDYQLATPKACHEDVISPEPLLLSWSDLHASPDRCAFRLLTGLYEGFGYTRHDVPQELSRETGELTIPD